MITVVRAPVYLTVQDEGRRFTRSSGVPRGGAMDSFALAATNIVVGNPPAAPALEWALTSGAVRFDRECVFAVGGASPEVLLAGEPIAPLTAVTARVGQELKVGAFAARRFLYVAVSGGFAVPAVLNSASTYLPGKFGGFEGRMIRSGDQLQTADSTSALKDFQCPRDLLLDYNAVSVRITRGPQAGLFGDDSWRALLTAEFLIAHASDRTGYRLEGNPIPHELGLLPSEAGCAGAIQVPLDGNPIVLMADAPTVGGYPKMAVVAEADLPLIAQKAPGDRVRFDLVTIEESQRALKRRAADLALLAARRVSGAASA